MELFHNRIVKLLTMIVGAWDNEIANNTECSAQSSMCEGIWNVYVCFEVFLSFFSFGFGRRPFAPSALCGASISNWKAIF